MSATYDRLAARYAAAWNRRFYIRVVDELVAGGDPGLRGRGLDLACGVGASTRSLRRAFPAIAWLGLDRSLPMLARFRQRAELAYVPVLGGAAESLPIADASLRLVVCSFALHWMEPEALVEAARVLDPAGQLLVAAPLRVPSPALFGNELLRRALLAERRRMSERPRAGFTVPEIETAFAAWHVHSLRVVTFVELYASEGALWRTLATRGTLAALFGPNAGQVSAGIPIRTTRAPIRFGWPVALVAASRWDPARSAREYPRTPSGASQPPVTPTSPSCGATMRLGISEVRAEGGATGARPEVIEDGSAEQGGPARDEPPRPADRRAGQRRDRSPDSPKNP